MKLGDTPEGNLQNNYKYQGSFSEMDADIGWNDFELRNYDAQIGRFVQQDPLQQLASPYTGMGNDPVNLIDPSGGGFIPCPNASQLSIFFMKAGETLGNVTSAINGISKLVSIGINFAKVGTEIFNNSVQTKIINRQLVGNMTMEVGKLDKGGNPVGLGNSVDASSGNPEPTYPLKTIHYFFAKGAYLMVEGIGGRGVFNIAGTITTVYDKNGNYFLNISISGDSPGKPDNPNGIDGGHLNFYGKIYLYADGNQIGVQTTNNDDIFNSKKLVIYDKTRSPMPGVSFKLPNKMPFYNLSVRFVITYQYFGLSGSASPIDLSTRSRAWLDKSIIIYSNQPAK